MKPVFVINSLSETVAKKGSKLEPLSSFASKVFSEQIFDNLDLIVAAGRNAGWVIIEGGDGTAQGIISAFLNQLDDVANIPKFTLLPGGMTNQVAKNIGLRKFTRKEIRSLLTSPRRETKTCLIRVSSEGYPTLYGFLFSTGGVPMVTEYTKAKLHSKGIGGSAAVIGGIIKGISGRDETVLRPTEISLHVNSKQHSGLHLGTLVTTLPSLLLGLDPFWGDGKGPLRLTYVDGSPKHLARHLAGLWLGKKDKNRQEDGLHSNLTHNIDMDYSGPVILDGEALSLGKSIELTSTIPVKFIL